jgi:dipeptidyl aminopeptidase/acylaminoacyl peptidase
MHTVKTSGMSFCYDESEILVTSNHNGVSNAHSIPVAGGSPRQLTFSTEDPIRALSYFPHDHRILYMQDKGGIENRHLCVREEDGRQVALTGGERVKSGFQGWSADGRFLYCASDERAEHHLDFFRIDTRTYERSLIFRNDEGFLLGNVSPDEHFATFIKYERFSDSNLYLYDLKSRTMQLITAHTGDAYFLPIYYAPNSRCLFYRTSQDEDAVFVYRYDLKTQTHQRIEEWPGRFRSASISESRRYRALILDERESTKLCLHDYSANRPVALKPMPGGNVTSVVISKSDRLLGFYVSGDRQPNELYVYDLFSGGLRKLTNNLNPDIDPDNLAESEIIKFSSFDGLEIPCLLWKPLKANASNPVPALVWVHGGPIGQIRKGYAPAVQYLVNNGYVVLGVNHRGSSGYGRAFLNAADRRQGLEPLWDCIEAKRCLATLDCVDSSRIGIIGGSFGGYMALAALTFHPQEFAVGVAISGVSNLLRHTDAKLVDPHLRGMYLQKIGDPKLDREMLRVVSPLFHAHNIANPLMVVHGAKDPRADKVESDDIVKAVRDNGGIVEYLEFVDEAHGFRKRANSIRAYQAILVFLDKYLKANVAEL